MQVSGNLVNAIVDAEPFTYLNAAAPGNGVDLFSWIISSSTLLASAAFIAIAALAAFPRKRVLLKVSPRVPNMAGAGLKASGSRAFTNLGTSGADNFGPRVSKIVCTNPSVLS